MGSLALSTSLSSSYSLSHKGKNTLYPHISLWGQLQFPSRTPNLRLNSYSNAFFSSITNPVSRSMDASSGAGFKSQAYLDEWAGATGGGVSAVQTPAMAQKSAEADVMGLLLKQRIVFLGSNMDDFVADAIISQLLLLDAQDPTKDIRLFINCPGGSISAAMGIYDAMQLCRADISTVAFGIAASTASIVLGGGSKGKRLAMPNTRIMMHQPLGGASGQAIDVEIQAKEIMYHKNNVTRIISESTGRPFEQVEKDIDRDRYMSPMEAMEYGLIDGVIDKDSIIPLFPLPERVKPRLDYKDASKDPRKFLTPVISDDEIY
eukprot:Gb_05917 [translate_table: standard]